LSEGLPNVAIEAMACGLPVVAFESSIAEAFTDGVEGFKIPLRDVDILASRLKMLVKDSDLRTRMSEKARMRAVRDFDIQNQGRKFLEMYRWVATR
jgi:glycosyltransferase involved in cell wall biosynthesis